VTKSNVTPDDLRQCIDDVLNRQELGKKAADAWARGEIDFERFYHQTPNRTWGASLNPTSQADILSGGGQRARIYEDWAA